MNRLNKGFGLIMLLLTLVIIAFLYYIMLGPKLNKTSLDKETKKVIGEQGIDTTNYKTTLDTTKAKIADIQDQRIKTFKENTDKLD